jgi:hypothetical protein
LFLRRIICTYRKTNLLDEYLVLLELKAISKTSLGKALKDVLEGQAEGTIVMFRNRPVYLPPSQTWAQTVAMFLVTFAQDLA